MINPETIDSIRLLTFLDPKMVEKVAALATIETVRKGEYLFKEGDYPDKLYSVLEGKVALEVENSKNSRVRVVDVLKNRTFGISSLVDSDDKKCISYAKTLTDCKLVVWNAVDLEKLFHQDAKLGLAFMKRIAAILKDRLQIKNAQLAVYS